MGEEQILSNKVCRIIERNAGIQKTTYNPKKNLRPSEIIKSDGIVEKIIEAMEQQFMELFDEVLDKKKL